MIHLKGGSTAHRSPSPAIPKCPQRLPAGHHEKGSAGASLCLTCPHTLLAADLRALSPLPLPLTYPMIMWLSGHLPLPGNKSSCSTPLDQAPKPSFLRLTPAGAQSSSYQRPLTSLETPNTTHWDSSIQHPLKELCPHHLCGPFSGITGQKSSCCHSHQNHILPESKATGGGKGQTLMSRVSILL